MLNRFSPQDVLDRDVIEPNVPKRAVLDKAVPAITDEFARSDALWQSAPESQTVLQAVIDFDFDAERLYLDWQQTSLNPMLSSPGAGDIGIVLAGIQLGLLSGVSEQHLQQLSARLNGQNGAAVGAANSMLAFFGHQPQRAVDIFQTASGFHHNKWSTLTAGLPAVTYALALIQQAAQQVVHPKDLSYEDKRRFKSLIARLNSLTDQYQAQFPRDPFMPVLRVLTDFARVAGGERSLEQTMWLAGFHANPGPWLDLFLSLCRHWLDEAPDEKLVANLAGHIERASEIGLHWFVDEGLTLLSALGRQRDRDDFQPQMRSTGWLAALYLQQQDWTRGLETLTRTANRHARLDSETACARRLCWYLHANGTELRIEPYEQRLNSRRQWHGNRRFPLKLLLDECGTLDFLCDDDLKICAHLRNCVQLDHSLYFAKNVIIDSASSLELIASHPRLYRPPSTDYDSDANNAEEKGKSGTRSDARSALLQINPPTLQVENDARFQEITLRLCPFPDSEIKIADQFHCEWREDNVLQVHRYSEGQLDIAATLGYQGLCVPAEGSESVLESLRAMAAIVEVHSDISSRSTDRVAASTQLVFHLRPLENGIDVCVGIYPLGADGALVLPGIGKPVIYAVVNRHAYHTERDLQAERDEAEAVLQQLPLGSSGDNWHWKIEDAEQALEVLAALQDLQSRVALYWPAGERIRLSSLIDVDQMHIHFGRQRDGLTVAGELKLENKQAAGGAHAPCSLEATTIDLKKLLASMEQTIGRFVRLDDGKMLQLSQRLQQQLQALNAVCENGVAPELAMPHLQQMSRGMVLQHDEQWEQQLQKLREAEALLPNPPKALKAELRDYQLEGFRWMMRLAHWGAGACLADDMGLGKTMQSLALLLSRGKGGPALVVAPTSVCGNWLAEAKCFAPSLRLHWLGNGNRSRRLRKAKAGDLFVCSYGVLQNDIDLLQAIDWHTIVADEAQSFKNPSTRRSQAMMSLRGDFRMIASGTPIENHLGELWNLFRFINPGLLGTSEKFRQRYAQPIEQREDDDARERLRSLIQPFILRRLKREVLTELPERTEITHYIEFNDQERDFYQSLREQAMHRIGQLGGLDHEQRFRVLSEITTLRQASCHPALVTENPPCGSAKMREFARIVDELRKNGHRCLVFSQFVSHLSLMRKHLDENRISYQYLDGSTSVRQRRQAVDDFQGGSGDLFLISLKAGGSGLNLTAADFVIHMDPWWNPAVEDQASDRAYRMGQKRPVTIYRMVVKDTIEEKIVNLHAHKRELANALLEGTDSTARLSVEQLVELIEEEPDDDWDEEE